MNKRFSAYTLALAVLGSSPAFASPPDAPPMHKVTAKVTEKPMQPQGDPICDPDDPRACSVYLRVGDKLPFDGVLLSPALAVRMDEGIRNAADQVDIERTTCMKRLALDEETSKKTMAAAQAATKAREAVINKTVADLAAEKTSAQAANIGTNVLVGVGAGVVGVIVGVVGAGVGVYYLTKK